MNSQFPQSAVCANDLDLFVARLRRETGPGAVKCCLAAASELVEHAAYEMAQFDSSQHVAQLILTASTLERISQQILPPSGPSGSV